jgi:organic hydroperoxide reductase OsmC/OhrA
MNKVHNYSLTVEWTGNKGSGTVNYQSYDRSFKIWSENKTVVIGSSDPAFRGDPTKYNPEELLVASLSTCHMLWFLHLCADNGIVVMEYADNPIGIMEETGEEGGKFKEVTLNPLVIVTQNTSSEILDNLHKKANQLCFIANSVNFPVYHKTFYKIKE